MPILSFAFIGAGIILFSLQNTFINKIFSLAYITFGCVVILGVLSSKNTKPFIYILLFLSGIFSFIQYLSLPEFKEVALINFCFVAFISVILLFINDVSSKNLTSSVDTKPIAIDPVKNRINFYLYSFLTLFACIIIGILLQILARSIILKIGATGGILLLPPAVILAIGTYAAIFAILFIPSLGFCFLIDIFVTQYYLGKKDQLGLLCGLLAGLSLVSFLLLNFKYFKLNKIHDIFDHIVLLVLQ